MWFTGHDCLAPLSEEICSYLDECSEINCTYLGK